LRGRRSWQGTDQFSNTLMFTERDFAFPRR
jgi:hypothetical protein